MFKNRIGYWVDQKGIKYKFLARECGVSAVTFWSWVNNKTQPDLIQAALISELLNVPIGELVIKEEEK